MVAVPSTRAIRSKFPCSALPLCFSARFQQYLLRSAQEDPIKPASKLVQRDGMQTRTRLAVPRTLLGMSKELLNDLVANRNARSQSVSVRSVMQQRSEIINPRRLNDANDANSIAETQKTISTPKLSRRVDSKSRN